MASQTLQLHFTLFPLMAPGHMIPMIDIAKLLAQRGVIVSIITTPHNTNRFAATIDRAVTAGLQIRLVQIRFPSAAEAGLPEGCENLDALPSLDMIPNFLVALSLLQKKVEDIFDEIQPRPNFLISPSISFISNNGCPLELTVIGQGGAIVGCKSACLAFNQPQCCCTGAYSTPATCKPSKYSQIV